MGVEVIKVVAQAVVGRGTRDMQMEGITNHKRNTTNRDKEPLQNLSQVYTS